MPLPGTRSFRAGESIEDYCRACKTDRMHTVMAADDRGQPIRVTCGYCRSEHHYRGGPRIDVAPNDGDASSRTPPASVAPRATPVTSSGSADSVSRAAQGALAAPTITGFTGDPMSDVHEFESVLRRVIREEAGLTAVEPAAKWRGGTLVLRPGRPGLQEKTWPIDAFFHKIVMLRNRLRTLEQQINAAEMPEDAKVRLQSYITGCYGSLTSFNLLFADENEGFKGSGGD